MEWKYPKIRSGMKLVYASWWLEFLTGILETIFNFALAQGNGGLFGTILTLVFGMVVYVLLIAGLYQAKKEEQGYKKVLYLLLAELIVAVVTVSLDVENMMILFIVLTLLTALLETLRICLFVKVTEKLVDREGDAGVAGYYKVIKVCYIVIYLGTTLTTLGIFVPFLEKIANVLIIPVMLCSLAAGVWYVLFLHNVTKFFHSYKKE